jgi:hypothetical protein
MTTTVEPALAEAISNHHRRFSPRYQGFLSDHGPMLALARVGLGAPAADAAAGLAAYQQRLERLSEAPPAYQDHLEAMLVALGDLGVRALLARELPGLVSGWARDAYHPLIRTAYGYAFGIDTEVAAGLAYLKLCGADPELERLARLGTVQGDSPAAFAAMSTCASRAATGRTFSDRLAAVIASDEFQAHVLTADAGDSGSAESLRSLCRRALAVFAATHDFFALHLVTGTHAFRILHEFAGPQRDSLLALGSLAGFAAAGAPQHALLPERLPPTPGRDDWLTLAGAGEHGAKIAWTACDQDRYWHDTAYTAAARAYLEHTDR